MIVIFQVEKGDNASVQSHHTNVPRNSPANSQDTVLLDDISILNSSTKQTTSATHTRVVLDLTGNDDSCGSDGVLSESSSPTSSATSQQDGVW